MTMNRIRGEAASDQYQWRKQNKTMHGIMARNENVIDVY